MDNLKPQDKELKLYTGEWSFYDFSERFVPSGYFDNMPIDVQLEEMSRIDGLDGFGPIYPTGTHTNDPHKFVKLLENYGLKVGPILVDHYGDKKWRNGGLSSNDKNTRKECIKLIKDAMDYAGEIPGSTLETWPGQDGYDYVFQTDYISSWKHLVESYIEICEHNINVKVAVEFKRKEPRQKIFVSDTGTMIMLFQDVKMENITGILDTGHALMSSHANLAEDMYLLNRYKKLDTIHLNDNYRDADPDLIYGTCVLWENLEFFYHLNKVNFNGWFEIEYGAPKEDRIKSLELAVKMIKKYNELAMKISENSIEIDNNLKDYRYHANMDLISNIVLNLE